MTGDVVTFLRRLLRRAPLHPAPRANSTAIAVLEHDLYGVQPAPGSMAALAIAMRKTAICLQHKPVEVTSVSDPQPNAVCQGCGRRMVQSEHGDWVIA